MSKLFLMMNDEEKAGAPPEATAVQGAVKGIIKPPPAVRLIVDKTANHVAQHGKSFEENIKKMRKAKFDFLNDGHPYHLYYLSKVDEFAVALHLESSASTTTSAKTQQEKNEASTKQENESSSSMVKSKEEEEEEEQKKKKKKEVEEMVLVSRAPKLEATASAILKKQYDKPPPEYLFTLNHPLDKVPSSSIDIIKLTAKYAAVLGRNFVQQVASREQFNPEFAFLRPNDDLFEYFTSLVDSYAKVLDFEGLVVKAEESFGEKLQVLDRAVHRVEYARKMAEKESDGDKKREELVAFNAIDWHDFVLVETIDFETITAPPSSSSSSKQTKQEEEEEESEEDMDLSSSDEDDDKREKIKIQKDYKPKVETGATIKRTLMTLPDGRKVDASDVNQHMRVELIDPKWKEQREKFLERQKTAAFVEKDIAQNIANLAKHRPDVFSTDEETARMAQQELKQKQNETIVWDGSANSIADVTATAEEVHKQRDKRNHEADSKRKGEVEPNAPPSIKRARGNR